MSFSYDIKTKLSNLKSECEFCKLAELYGIISFSSTRKKNKISIITEHEGVADKIKKLTKECVGIDLSEKEYSQGYRFLIEDEISIEQTEDTLNISGENSDSDEIIPFECCRASFIRGAFLGGGSISDPQKNYHLEFDAKTKKSATELVNILKKEGIEAKITSRKNQHIVYLKGYEKIAGILGIIGAGLESLEIYNVSIEKEIRNSVNRKMNCENANMDKIVKAYGKHFVAIEKIKNTIGFDSLPESLKEIAKVRMEYPDESLKELGERLENPIGKSGVNHRLERLMEIAEKL